MVAAAKATRTDAPLAHEHRGDEGSDEEADPEGAAQGGKCAGAHLQRDGLGEVGLAGQSEDGTSNAGDRDGDRQERHRCGQERAQQRESVQDTGRDQGTFLADPDRQCSCGEIADQLTKSDQGDDE